MMDLGIRPLKIKSLLESNPPKSRSLARGLTVKIGKVRGSDRGDLLLKGVGLPADKGKPPNFLTQDPYCVNSCCVSRMP